jgi:hypothetical protein
MDDGVTLLRQSRNTRIQFERHSLRNLMEDLPFATMWTYLHLLLNPVAPQV